MTFTDTEFRWFDRPVLVEKSKSSDSLPWTFFKDGVREIQLARGFEQEELGKFLDILQRVRKAAPDEDDLLTMLWEADFTHLRYRYVDLGAEPVTNLESEDKPQQASSEQVQAAAHEAPEESRPGVVNMDDFDATLYFLDEKELQYLRGEIDREYESDLRHNVLAILFDIYEAQAVDAIREEIGGILGNLMLLLLAAGQMRSVAQLLATASMVIEGGKNITPQQKEQLGRLAEQLSQPEPLGQLLQALDESAELPGQAALSELFEQLRPSALETIFSWLPRLQNPKIRLLVEQSADRLASANTTELVKCIQSSQRAVALEAIRRGGSMKSSAAVIGIAKALGSPDVVLRQTAVQALTEIGSAGALQALERSIEDSDRDVRVGAVRALGARAYRGVFNRLESVVKGKSVRDADLTEKMAFFEAYGAMCGDNGVPYLDEILNGKSMFGKREDGELRACAAIALGRIATAKARQALQQSANEKDVVVRNAVNRAMRAGAA